MGLGIALLVAGHAGLLATYRLDRYPGLTLVLLAISFIGWVVVGTALARRTAPSALTILGVALLLRALVLPLPPALSDDVLRYLWDGKVVAAGFARVAVRDAVIHADDPSSAARSLRAALARSD